MIPKNRKRVQFITTGTSKVDQSQRDTTDINKIVARAKRTGHFPQTGRQPFYADVSHVGSLLDSYEVVQRAEVAFSQLPAQVRRDMDNDPRNLESWLSDPKNLDQAVQHGLLTRPPEASPEPAKAPEPKARTASPAAPKTSPKGEPAGEE